MRVYLWVAIVGLLAACAGSGAPPVQRPAAAASSPSAALSSPEPTAAGTLDLRGNWVEYWAVNGAADTEGYSFSQDGRFTWRAPKNSQSPNTAIQKAGNYRVEHAGAGQRLVLQIENERFAPCSAPCESAGAPRDVQHSTPLTEQYEIGECPTNQEAEQLDSSYTCRAFGGKAFWRKLDPSPHAADATAQRG
jgi:hypothetical protein